jgi:hypothetical protein
MPMALLLAIVSSINMSLPAPSLDKPMRKAPYLLRSVAPLVVQIEIANRAAVLTDSTETAASLVSAYRAPH